MIELIKRLGYKHWIVFICSWIWLGVDMVGAVEIGDEEIYWGIFLIGFGIILLISEFEPVIDMVMSRIDAGGQLKELQSENEQLSARNRRLLSQMHSESEAGNEKLMDEIKRLDEENKRLAAEVRTAKLSKVEGFDDARPFGS